MGYRSDVKLILTNKGMEMLRAKVPKPTGDEPYWTAEPIYDASKICDGKYWLIEWEDIKWYDDWDDYIVPCAVKGLLKELFGMGEPFSFMRVGEEYTDVEVETCVDWDEITFPYLTLKREIEVEY